MGPPLPLSRAGTGDRHDPGPRGRRQPRPGEPDHRDQRRDRGRDPRAADPSDAGPLAVLLAGASTIGALFGTPVAAALLFTGILAALNPGGSLWDRLFLPVAAAGAAATDDAPPGRAALRLRLPDYGAPQAIDFVTGTLLTCAIVLIGMVALFAFPFVYRGLRALRHPHHHHDGRRLCASASWASSAAPITMFKGLTQMGELLERSRRLRRGTVRGDGRASRSSPCWSPRRALFRGGRIFPATFIGAAPRPAGERALPVDPDRARGRLRESSASWSSSRATAGSHCSSPSPLRETSPFCRCCAIILPAWLWSPRLRSSVSCRHRPPMPRRPCGRRPD